MTWKQLLKEGRVEAVPASRPEIDDMRAIVAHCLTDAALPLFPDNKFGLVYNAARTLAAMAAHAAGYRVRPRGGGHYNTFVALRAAMGPSIYALADYLNDCRMKRNELSYGSFLRQLGDHVVGDVGVGVDGVDVVVFFESVDEVHDFAGGGEVQGDEIAGDHGNVRGLDLDAGARDRGLDGFKAIRAADHLVYVRG